MTDAHDADAERFYILAANIRALAQEEPKT
jgi:hypothetical protein